MMGLKDRWELFQATHIEDLDGFRCTLCEEIISDDPELIEEHFEEEHRDDFDGWREEDTGGNIK